MGTGIEHTHLQTQEMGHRILVFPDLIIHICMEVAACAKI